MSDMPKVIWMQQSYDGNYYDTWCVDKINEDDTDNEIVDRWFTQVCRNIVMEVYEQDMADPEKRMMEEIRNRDLRVIQRKDLGDGRAEIS